MKILIAGTELNVTKCFPYEAKNGKRTLEVTIPQSEIEYAALKEVLAASTGEIVLTKDDGTTQTFVGYTATYEITDKAENEVAVWYIVIQCTAEAERRAWEAQQKAAELELTVVALTEANNKQAETITAQAAEIELLNNTLLEVLMG